MTGGSKQEGGLKRSVRSFYASVFMSCGVLGSASPVPPPADVIPDVEKPKEEFKT